MVVRRGQEWGDVGVPDAAVPIVNSDRELFELLACDTREFVLAHGDLARTVGATEPTAGSAYRQVRLDLIGITFQDGGDKSRIVLAASHCLIRSPWWRGGFMSGPVVVICNAQYVKGRDLAPRSHPNDGKVEIVEFRSNLSIRDRSKVLNRTKTGDHVPHPSISVRQTSSRVELGSAGVVIVDGHKIGRGIVHDVEPLPDAATAWIPFPG